MSKKVNQLKIALNVKYRSFKKGFTTVLEGDLIIITGVNGSGKSQLLDYLLNRKPDLMNNSDFKLNNQRVNLSYVIKKSFVDMIGVQPISQTNPANLAKAAKEIASKFRDINEHYDKGRSFERFRELADKETRPGQYRDDKEVFKQLSHKESRDFVWQSDDIFNHYNLYGLIRIYLLRRLNFMAKTNGVRSTLKKKFEAENPPIWESLNEIFTQLSFGYRFASNYEFIPNSVDFKGGLNILDLNNKPLEFGIDSLSDGEKAIFSLAIAGAKSKMEKSIPKILLLDEYDATFNPSLTEAFYKILVEFFVKQGVTVILTTHNPITATFAPTDIEGKQTTFYEMYKESENPKRIVEKTQEEVMQIGEVKKVLERFYPQIGHLKKIIQDLKKPILAVEDEYIQIYKVAFLKVKDIDFTKDNLDHIFDTNSPFEIIGAKSAGSITGMLNMANSDFMRNKTIIGLFDYDGEGTKQFHTLIEKRLYSQPISHLATTLSTLA